MDSLRNVLETQRRRIRVRRALESAARWAFYASLAGALTLFARKFLGVPVPQALATGVLLAVPAGMAARTWVRRYSLRDCAIHLDRLLGLEERLSTALEGAGPLSAVVTEDASRALGRASFPERRLPLESRLLAPSLVLLGALAAVPAPDRDGFTGDRSFEAVLAGEAVRLEALAAAEIRFREVAELLSQGRPEEALAVLQTLRDVLEQRLLESGAAGGSEALRRQAEQAAASAAAISAELARLGRTVHAPPPRAAEAKLARQRDLAAIESATAPDGEPAKSAAVFSRKDWDSRYDAVIRRYFGSRP